MSGDGAAAAASTATFCRVDGGEVKAPGRVRWDDVIVDDNVYVVCARFGGLQLRRVKVR